MDKYELKQLIQQGLPNAIIEVNGDDGTHFDAIVVDASFTGKTMLKQHQIVFAALGEHFQNNSLHALGLKTYTPEQWEKQQ